MASPPRNNNKNINSNNNNSDDFHAVTPKRKLERPSLLVNSEIRKKSQETTQQSSSSKTSSPMRSRTSTGTFREKRKLLDLTPTGNNFKNFFDLLKFFINHIVFLNFLFMTEDEKPEKRISNNSDDEPTQRDSKIARIIDDSEEEKVESRKVEIQANITASSSPRFLRPQRSIEDFPSASNSRNSSQNSNLAGELYTGCTQQLNSMNFETSNFSQTSSNFQLHRLFGIEEADDRPEVPNSEFFEHLSDHAISPNVPSFPTRLNSANVSTPIARTENNHNNLSAEIATSTIHSIFNNSPNPAPPLYLAHQDSGYELTDLDFSNNMNHETLFDIPFDLKDYKNIGHLGSGGSSIVYKGVPPTQNLSEMTAIKRFENPQETDTTELRKKRESNRTQAINEVRILNYLHSGSHGHCHYVMQAIRHEQTDLHDYIELELMDDSLDNLMSYQMELKKKLQDSGYYNHQKIDQACSYGLRLDVLMEWTFQMVDGLAHCHNNHIIHRDIKPQNILVLYKENLTKLADFGLSCFNHEKLTDIVGTTAYFSPEMWFTQRFVAGNKGLQGYAKIVPNANSDTLTIQELEEQKRDINEKLALFGKNLDSYIGYSEKVDIWALGCVLVHLASGRALYTQQTFSEMILNENLNFQEHGCRFSFNKAIAMMPEYLKDDPLYASFVSFLDLCFVHCPDERADVNELLCHDFICDEEGRMSSEDNLPLP